MYESYFILPTPLVKVGLVLQNHLIEHTVGDDKVLTELSLSYDLYAYPAT